MNFRDFSSTGLLNLAKKVEVRVMEKLEADLKDDLSMRQMFVQDCADGLAICELLIEGNRTAVVERLHSMDTAPREYLIEFIEDIAGVDFFDIILDNG